MLLHAAEGVKVRDYIVRGGGGDGRNGVRKKEERRLQFGLWRIQALSCVLEYDLHVQTELMN